jgi:ABC-type branched-subunit amino acid transport system substrate-binding protein
MSPGEPLAEFVAYKYARLLLHAGKGDEAFVVLDKCLQAHPSGRFSHEARAARDRLAAMQKVDPKSVGLLLPLSGEFKAYGGPILRAVLLAAGGAGAGAPDLPGVEGSGSFSTSDGIAFKVMDTAGAAEKAAASLDELVMQRNVIAVIGPVFTGPASSAAVRASEIGLPIVTLSRKEGITETGPWVLRNCLTNSSQAEAVARIAVERMGVRTVAIMYPNSPYGVELANFFWDAAERFGAEVTGVEHYDPNQTTFTVEARKLVGKFFTDARRRDRDDEVVLPKWAEGMSGPRLERLKEKYKKSLPPVIDFEAIFIPDYHDKVSLVVPALAVEDIMFTNASKEDLKAAMKATGFKDIKTVQLLGGNGWDSPNLPERAGKFVDGSVFVDGFFAGSEGEETKRFVEEFKKLYGGEPGLLEAHAYDTARMIIDIIRKQNPKSRLAMRQALLAVKDFPGAAGRTSFQPNGEVKKELFVITVESGQLRELGRIVP